MAVASNHGVELQFCGSIPLVSLETSSCFYQHVSQMLQQALGSAQKVNALYLYYDDEQVYSQCWRDFGLGTSDVMLVRVTQASLKHVKALGTTRRAAMFALVLAVAVAKNNELDDLWSLLKSYSIDQSFWDILQMCKNQNSEESGEWSGTSGCHGVQVNMVCGNVPLVTLEKDSIFQENAAGLLQVACGSAKKADALYKYCNDKSILAECRKLGLGPNLKESILIARINVEAVKNAKDLKAAGLSGKRSVMLALVVALIQQGSVQLKSFMAEASAYDKSLEGPLSDLVCQINSSGACSGQALKRPSTSLASPVEELSPMEQEARSKRARRFESSAVSTENCGFGDKVEKAKSTDEAPVQGRSQNVEKPFLRLTSLARASDVRPEPVLQQAFAKACEQWSQTKDWVVVGDMLQSIRQDLTVQMIRTPFAVEVYEFSVRASLEVGDFRNYEQCSKQLEELHNVAQLGPSRNHLEILFHRLLYLSLLGTDLEMNMFLCQHKNTIKAGMAADNKHLIFAWEMRASLQQGNAARTLRVAEQLLAEVASGSLGTATEAIANSRLVKMVCDEARLQQVSAICHAYKGRPVTRSMLAKMCRHSVHKCNGENSVAGLPVVYVTDKPELVDVESTKAQVDQLLKKPGTKGRTALGEQRSDHVRGFVRRDS